MARFKTGTKIFVPLGGLFRPVGKPHEWCCAHADCDAQFDPREHYHPPKGWASVIMKRYGSAVEACATLLVCPKHTIELCTRQLTLKMPGTRHEKPFDP